MIIELQITLTLIDKIKKKENIITIQKKNSSDVFLKNNHEIKMSVDIGTLDNDAEFLPLFSISGISKNIGQQILINKVKINSKILGEESQDYFDFKILKGPLIEKSYEIFDNGELRLALKRIKDRLFWFPWYYGHKQDDFVFDNRLFVDFSTPNGHIPWDIETQTTEKKYLNKPHHDYDSKNIYDMGAFGCSVTYGSAMSRNKIWPYLITPNHINLSLPGLGIDGIFHNLKNGIDKFRCEKIIILLPNFDRKLLHIEIPDRGYTRIPVTTGDGRQWLKEWDETTLKHWGWKMLHQNMSNDFLKKWKLEYNKICWDIIQDKVQSYSIDYIKKIIELCRSNKIEFYIGSWSTETFEYITANLKNNEILPFFEKIDLAEDRIHPGPKSHKLWADLIKEKLKLNNNL